MKKLNLLKSMMLLMLMTFSMGAWADSWQLVSSVSNIEAGETYLIATNNKTSVYNGSTASGHLSTSAGTLSGSTFTAPSNAYEVTLVATSTANTYYIQRKGDGKYIKAKATSSGSFDQAATTGFAWTFANASAGGFNVTGTASNSTVYFRSYSNSTFRTYGNTNGASIYLYKKITTTPTYALTFASNAQGSFSAKVDGNTISSGTKVEAGKKVTLTANPDDGYAFNAWNVYKTGNQYNTVTVANDNTFTMPDAAVTVDAYFRAGLPNAQVSLAAGTYRGEQSVTITNLDESEYSYYYTLDGTTPEIDGSMEPVGTTQEYSGAIDITESCTLSILTTDLTDSKVNTFAYVIEYPYTVTIEEPVNGTLTVMYGETPVHSGDQFYKGDIITATATPDAGYNFGRLRFFDTANHDFTASNVKEWNMGSHDITISATFVEKQYYTVAFSVNGTTVQSDLLEKNTTVTAPAVSDINGKKFMGWVETEIVGTTNTEPSFINTNGLTAVANKTYHAVFATKTGDGSLTTATLDASDKSTAGYGTGTQDDSEGNTWNYNASINNQSGTLYFGLNTNANNYYVGSPDFGQNITAITIKAYNGSSSAARKLLICSNNETAQPSTGDLAEVTVNKSERFTTSYEVDLSEAGDFSQFYIYAAAALGVSEVAVTYGSAATYSDYTTTPATPTTISIRTIEGYGTFVCADAVEVPANVRAAVAEAEDNKLVWNWMYEAGDVIPANTPVLVNGEKGTYAATITTGGTAPATNYLYANTTGAAAQANIIAPEAAKFYALTYNTAGEDLGFYWRAAEGASFSVADGKVFLGLPADVQAKTAFVFGDETDGIENVSVDMSDNRAYNLAGQRVNANAKGIVIVNGRKYINK